MKNKTPYTYAEYLETERLRSRKLTEADAEAWTAFCSDPDAIEFFPLVKQETPKEAAIKWIQKQLDRYEQKRFGLQALMHKDTHEFIGQCGLLSQEVEGAMELEVGYHIFKKYWGQGYAPEASRLFIDYAFRNGLTSSVISIIDVKNVKSQRVAEKNNLKWEKQLRWNDLDVYIYRIHKDDNTFKI